MLRTIMNCTSVTHFLKNYRFTFSFSFECIYLIIVSNNTNRPYACKSCMASIGLKYFLPCLPLYFSLDPTHLANLSGSVGASTQLAPTIFWSSPKVWIIIFYGVFFYNKKKLIYYLPTIYIWRTSSVLWNA